MPNFNAYEQQRCEKFTAHIDIKAPKLWSLRNLGIFTVGVWHLDGNLHCLPYLSTEPSWDKYACGIDTIHHFGLIANMEDEFEEYFGHKISLSQPKQDGYKGSLRGFASLSSSLRSPLKKECRLDFFHAPDDATHHMIDNPSERTEAVTLLRDSVDEMALSLSSKGLRIAPSYREGWYE